MLVLIALAKLLVYSNPLATERYKQLEVLDAPEKLINSCRTLRKEPIACLMNSNSKLSALTLHV